MHPNTASTGRPKGGILKDALPRDVALRNYQTKMLQTRTVSEDLNPAETAEWLEALDQIIDEVGHDRARFLLNRLADRAYIMGVSSPVKLTTPYVNTIPVEDESPYPGNLELEERITALIRWNALAMVVRANKYDDG